MRYRDKGPESPKRAGDRRTLDAVEVRGRRRRADPDVSRAIGLDRIAGQSVEMRANNVPIAAGEVIVVDDQYAVRITSIGNRREQQSSGQPDQPGEDLQDEPAED